MQSFCGFALQTDDIFPFAFIHKAQCSLDMFVTLYSVIYVEFQTVTAYDSAPVVTVTVFRHAKIYLPHTKRVQSYSIAAWLESLQQ